MEKRVLHKELKTARFVFLPAMIIFLSSMYDLVTGPLHSFVLFPYTSTFFPLFIFYQDGRHYVHKLTPLLFAT